MAEKKYIGKPGKQDDPCWKGYEMVGMKKKGGRKVPNCVPEATDIIAKAKAAVAKKAGAKLKLDPDTGTPDHFTAAQRRKKGLDEAGSKQHIEVTHTTGQKSKKPVHPDNAFKALNHYRSLSTTKSARIVSEADSKEYPRKGFPEEGDYGYHPNPGLKPQESDKDQDMDKAYKKATEKEGRKPLNAKVLEIEEKWMVKKGTEVVSTHKTKDEADVKAMKHPLFKVYAKEEAELDEAHGMWKVDFPKQHAGKAVAAGSVHVKAQNTAHAHKVAAKRVGVDHKMFKSKVTKSSILPEELGKDNEWGRPELRKKFAAMTPGQESMAADKIPTFDPRYDDVTTQYCGGIKEGYLAEISARGAEARAKFQAKVRQTLADPKNIARAKKTLAKKKEAEKSKEAPHLVMQLRKAVSIGSKVHFQDGQHHTIAPNHADIFMSKYNSAKTSIEKEALQKRAHKSHSEFMRTIAEEAHENCGTPDCCQMCDTAEMGTHHVDSYEAHKGSGDQISPVISHDDEDIRFQDFDESAFEKELEADVLALSWDDLVDLYDEDEIEYDESPEKEEEGEDLEEGITPSGRLKKKFNAMRTKSRRMMARNIAIKRVSSPEKLKSRSVRAARRMVYKRLLRNRDISSVSSAEKTRLEAQIKRMAPMVARLSVRVMPAVRKLEQSRIKNSRTRKKK
jgi:hypothetical protein